MTKPFLLWSLPRMATNRAGFAIQRSQTLHDPPRLAGLNGSGATRGEDQDHYSLQ